MIYLTKKSEFSASHRLFNPTLTDDENFNIYGLCSNKNGHGHNYSLEVTVKGEPEPETGFVIDLKKLKTIIETEIIEKVDHKHLNYDVDFLRGIIPTVENLAAMFWKALLPKLSGCQLHKIKLNETGSSWIEYFGDEFEIKKYEL
jgi:6-pyruvoyltetrahydropterin/6-carboxytetrahydropterin synthase